MCNMCIYYVYVLIKAKMLMCVNWCSFVLIHSQNKILGFTLERWDPVCLGFFFFLWCFFLLFCGSSVVDARSYS